MTNRNKNNRIVFLTTLSVYLGLVLVGAPPTLAQNDVSNFPHIKRANKFVCPNNGLIGDEIGKEINPFDYALAERLIELIRTTDQRILVVEEIEEKTADLPFFFKHTEFAPYYDKANNIEKEEWKNESSDWASAAHAGQIAELHSLFLNPLSDCSKPSKQKFVLNFSNIKIDKDRLNSELIIKKASKVRAEQLAENLGQIFDSRAASSTDQAVKEVYRYTEVRSENDQVFIVTRLPRGSLDELLKQDAKAKK